ncbi:MarR family winged helix-turn-helix transcriptional regulator [Pseudomonas helleri]|uniref:MarR family winged helix-turn-helix transcriptional regulator n=1 Tax=Pseudomonas helleri TaxID=1608996 RepID=UPI00389A0394
MNTLDWDLFAKPAPLINMAARSFSRLGERRLKSLGLNVAQVPVLYLLRNGEALSQKSLAQLTRVEQPSMAQTLVRMEREGLIQRTPAPDDRRSQLISLTGAALAKLPAAREALDAGSSRALEGFSDAEAATLLALLRRLNQNLDRMVIEEALL